MRSNEGKSFFPILGVLAHILEKSTVLKFEELPVNDKRPDLKVFNIESPSKGWAFLSLLPVVSCIIGNLFSKMTLIDNKNKMLFGISSDSF